MRSVTGTKPLQVQSRLEEFADGLQTVLVFEEKDGFIERQVKAKLYGKSSAPAIWGKSGPDGRKLLSSVGDLTPEGIAACLGAFLASESGDNALNEASKRVAKLVETQGEFALRPALRKPFFCSGCPHNRSTVVPEGSRASAGIGCHGLAAYNRPRTSSFAQMGGEGIHWMGLSPFTDEAHLFANMGDGTYFHSGLLAIRQAVAARLNITYKVLYNSAVAMTGGQSVDGELSVHQMVDQLRAEGVTTIFISTDDPHRYDGQSELRGKVERIEHRDDLDALQLELRQRQGVSIILYEQMCATEKRRLRKRGKLADPDRRLFINELVCEGCGDCSAKSNCLSVEPVETALGTKRRINQSSCNKDYSCINGFCPSFVSVEGGRVRKSQAAAEGKELPPLPPPILPVSGHQRIVVAGVGGTGVVTIGALAAMATHMRGNLAGVLDQVGMAQKGGAVVSHIHLATGEINALRVAPGEADLVIACDQIVGNMRDVMAAIMPGKTNVVANTDVSITGDFTQDRSAVPDGSLLARRLRQRAGDDRVLAHPFTLLAERLFGDAIASNQMMTGAAWQMGWIDLDLDAFLAAVRLNGVAVKLNENAFDWGRRLAADPQAVYEAAGFAKKPGKSLAEIVEGKARFLTAYQNASYAERYRTRVAKVEAAEKQIGGEGKLSLAVAKGLFKVMAYKDEYEVARLYTDGSFAEALKKGFDGKIRLSFHMAPPLLARRDKTTGELRKLTFGPWLMPFLRLLAKGRVLRGTAFDPLGLMSERKAERQLITDYQALLDTLLAGLEPSKLDAATEIAGLVDEVRGYGEVKNRAMRAYAAKVAAALAQLQDGAGCAVLKSEDFSPTKMITV